MNILLCDDGLPHHALARDVEICVFDGRGIGNGWLLPAGPLREAWPRPVSLALFTEGRISLAAAGLPIAEEKWFTNLPYKGNTGSAAIYIILEEFMRREDIRHGQKILCYIPESGRFSTCFMLLEAVYA